MKILHTSDWHLGKHLNNFSRHPEQELVLNEICEIAESEQVNVIVISGDLFDSFNPAVESVDLFYKTLKNLSSNGKRAVIAIAGNHDSPDRIEAPDPLARECGIIFAGYPNSKIPVFSIDSGLSVNFSTEGFFILTVPGIPESVRVIITPYANEYRLKTYLGQVDQEAELRSQLKSRWKEIAEMHCDTTGINIMISHLLFMKRGEAVPEEPEDEKPILHIGGAQIIYSDDIPEQIQYTALGHLHRRQYVCASPAPVIYSGSPLAYSFSETNQKKYVQIIEVFPGTQAKVSSVELITGKKLLRKRVESVDEAIEWLSEHQDALIELSIVTETFLTSEDRKKLSLVHSGIVSIIPEVKNQGSSNLGYQNNIDLTKDMESLFVDFFKHNKGQLPNEEILNLFREILSVQDSN